MSHCHIVDFTQDAPGQEDFDIRVKALLQCFSSFCHVVVVSIAFARIPQLEERNTVFPEYLALLTIIKNYSPPVMGFCWRMLRPFDESLKPKLPTEFSVRSWKKIDQPFQKGSADHGRQLPIIVSQQVGLISGIATECFVTAVAGENYLYVLPGQLRNKVDCQVRIVSAETV